jgi:hypothetical protein
LKNLAISSHILEMELLILPFAWGKPPRHGFCLSLFILKIGKWACGSLALGCDWDLDLSLRLSGVVLALSRGSLGPENKDIANVVLSIFSPSFIAIPIASLWIYFYLWCFAVHWGTAGFPLYRLKNYLIWSVQFPFWLIMKLLTTILIGRYPPIHLLTFVTL